MKYVKPAVIYEEDIQGKLLYSICYSSNRTGCTTTPDYSNN